MRLCYVYRFKKRPEEANACLLIKCSPRNLSEQPAPKVLVPDDLLNARTSMFWGPDYSHSPQLLEVLTGQVAIDVMIPFTGQLTCSSCIVPFVSY